MTSTASRPRLLTRSFLLASASHFFHGLSFNVFLHLPGFLKHLGADEVRIGIVYGLTALTAILARPAMGRVMDRRGRRVVILAGGMLNAVVSALYLTVSAFGPWLYVVRIAHGLGEAMLFASLFAFAADLVPASRRIEGIALFGVSGMLPISLGGLLGDAILARAGYHELFIAAAVLGAIAVALSLPLRDVPRLEHESPARGILAAAFQRDLLPIWFMGGVFATALASYFTFLKTFVLHAGFGSIGVFFTLYSVSAVLLRVFFGSLPDRVGPKRMLLPALASLVAGLLVLACATSSTEVALAGVLCGLGHGYTFPILLGLVVGRARSSERGAALALFTALFDGGTLVGGPLFGVLIQTLSYRPMFATAAGFVVVAAGIFSVWDRRGRCAARP